MPLLTLLLVSCVPVRTVPNLLREIERRAEEAYEQAIARASDSLARDVEAVRAAWERYRGTAKADGAGDFLLMAVDRLIQELEEGASKPETMIELARLANAITGFLDELYSLYEPTTPPAVTTLGYGGREVTLDAMESDPEAARDDLANLNASWWGVRDEVLQAGGDVEAAEYEASLQRQVRLLDAQDLAGLRAESDFGLGLVNNIRAVFEEAEAPY